MSSNLFFKMGSLIAFAVLLVFISLITVANCGTTDTIELAPTENHHVTELNSNQPYVAGFHVNTPDLNTITRGAIATAVTVSFPSTNTSYFPQSSWLGAGMFVQAQDSRYLHIDYGFYTTLVLDSAGNLFIDIGLHQTREERAPLHMPTEELVYAYSWQLSGIDKETPITLYAKWDSEGWVHYSIYVSGANITLKSINVASLPDCENIIRSFYAGNVINNPFPYGCFVQYFQFGVVSSEPIANPHWFVNLKNPMFLKEAEWRLVETAWSIQGDISYMDGSWMWGGTSYPDVSAQYYKNPLENPWEIIFFYNGQTLRPGTILWQSENAGGTSTIANSQTFSPNSLVIFSNYVLCSLTWILSTLKRIHVHTKEKTQ